MIDTSVKINGLDAFLHTLVVGPTGCGKTSRVLKPKIAAILKAIKQGKKVGLTVLEPKGDLAADIAHWCNLLEIPCIYIDPLNPNTHRFNPLQGDPLTAAEVTRSVLKSLFGKQEAFFALVQETASRNTVLLLKILEQHGMLNNTGNPLELMDVVRTLRSTDNIKKYVNQLKQLNNPEYDDLIDFFQIEILGSLKDKYQQFAMGLRAQLEDIAGNTHLKHILSGKSDIDLDQHLDQGGVFLINSELKLGAIGDSFGKFIVQHMMSAVFRRPGTEWNRTPHYFIMDEFPRYCDPDVERLLAIGRSFRCATTLALQDLAQLDKQYQGFSKIVLTNTRNRVIFGGLSADNAMLFAKEAGKSETFMRQSTYKHKILIPSIFPSTYRDTKTDEDRITYTKIMEIKKFHFMHIIMKNDQRQKPGIAKGLLVDEKDLLKTPDGRKKVNIKQKKIKAELEEIKEEPLYKEVDIHKVQKPKFKTIKKPSTNEVKEKMKEKNVFNKNQNPQEEKLPVNDNKEVKTQQKKQQSEPKNESLNQNNLKQEKQKKKSTKEQSISGW
ncbi:type IV secretory system conjugative DNA transfer family protein [Chengkuizengella sediminis]|uniref:type IV secretory system conjugative DNA transfer family protein n=1 Tax=Chengkuizengella sediminis TaxID=1885917 RepID=UPI00138A63EF|nr:TraM recognition domain-containing protein [Chengkuizengella sediminis]NDI36622.1 TraM recognition domain-containing protein [Chengkuizengella sediminis]